MSLNLISAVVTDDQFNRFIAIMEELDTLLDGVLIGLSADDRRSYGMMGDRTRAFTGHAHSLVNTYPALFPSSVDAAEFNQDLALHDRIAQMQRRLTPFYEKLGDTAMAAGYDAYQHALDIYGYAKIASPDAGVEMLVKEMKQLFKRTPRKPPAAEGPA